MIEEFKKTLINAKLLTVYLDNSIIKKTYKFLELYSLLISTLFNIGYNGRKIFRDINCEIFFKFELWLAQYKILTDIIQIFRHMKYIESSTLLCASKKISLNNLFILIFLFYNIKFIILYSFIRINWSFMGLFLKILKNNNKKV